MCQTVLIWAINVFAVPPLVFAAAHYLLGKRVWATPVVVTMIAAAEFFVGGFLLYLWGALK